MPIDGGATTVLSAVSGALTTTIRITEKVFEILAVGEQSRSLLATIDQVNQQLETAKMLREQKSDWLSPKENQSINQTFLSTEIALDHVAKLVERARVDQQVHGGKVGFQSRMLFVLRDSPNIMVSLTQLGIANQQLNTTVIILDHRQSPRINDSSMFSGPSMTERRPPPGYEESQMIAAVRQRNIRKRASALGVNTQAAGVVDGEPQLHHSSSTQSLPVEMPGDPIMEDAECSLDVDFDKLSITSSLLDGMYNHGQPIGQNSLRPPALGRARSRRWLESHCS